MDDASDKTMHFSSASSGDRDSVDELSSTLSGQLKITSENHCIDDEDEDEYFSEEYLLAQMGYAKAEEEEEEEEDNEPVKDKPITTPIAELNLVSALKGSRDKEEGRRRAEECRVSWAPDVYDPPCSSDDHFTGSRSDGHRGGGGRETEGSRHGGKGSSKGNVGGSKGGRGSKEKRKAEKKHKKRGDY